MEALKIKLVFSLFQCSYAAQLCAKVVLIINEDLGLITIAFSIFPFQVPPSIIQPYFQLDHEAEIARSEQEEALVQAKEALAQEILQQKEALARSNQEKADALALAEKEKDEAISEVKREQEQQMLRARKLEEEYRDQQSKIEEEKCKLVEELAFVGSVSCC